MTAGREPDLTRLIRDLTRELQRLQRELEPDRRGRFPTPRELSRFTSEVAIPGVILFLETQIRVLQLLRRTLRLAEDRDSSGEREHHSGAHVRNRAEQLGETALLGLGETLGEIESSLDQAAGNEDAREVLSEAQELQRRIREELAADATTADDADEKAAMGVEREPADAVQIDVEAELESLKENVDSEAQPSDGTVSSGGNQEDDGEDPGDDSDGDRRGESEGSDDSDGDGKGESGGK